MAGMGFTNENWYEADSEELLAEVAVTVTTTEFPACWMELDRDRRGDTPGSLYGPSDRCGDALNGRLELGRTDQTNRTGVLPV